MRIAINVACVLILVAVAIVAFKYCAKKELLDYAQGTIARFKQQAGSPAQLLSVESKLAERRRKEQHCLRLTSCLFSDPNSLEYGASFSNCLEEDEH
jgi:hypothetical protein